MQGLFPVIHMWRGRVLRWILRWTWCRSWSPWSSSFCPTPRSCPGRSAVLACGQYRICMKHPTTKSSLWNAKKCNTLVSPWQFYCDPSSNIYIEPFMSPLKKKWWRGWLRSRSHMESGLRGRLNWHHTKLLVLSISEEVSSIWSLQANNVWWKILI